MPIETHTAQSIREFNTIKEQHGVNPIEYLYKLGVLTSQTILGHTIFITSHRLINENQEAPELDLIAKTGTAVAHCLWVFARVGRTMESYTQIQR